MHVSEWAWVFLGYAICFVMLAGYLLSLRLRQARTRRRMEEVR